MCDASGDVAPFATATASASSSAASNPAFSTSKSIASTSSNKFDPTYYTWSTLFRGIIGTASDQEMKQYIHNRSLLNEAADCARCEKWRDWLFQFSPTVQFLRQNVEKLGGDLDASNVLCRRCDTLSPTGIKQGAFAGDMGILLCANHVKDKKTMEDVLAHEMVHAYDYMRFKYDKWNLKHMACTEIRANTLSGECRWVREFWTRKQFRFTQHFQECVRRRAALAVSSHRDCKDDTHAVKVVNEVWESCFPDTRPFDEIYK